MAGAWRGMFTQQQIQVDPPDGQVTSAWRRHLSPISASSGIPCITRDGKSWMSNVHRTQIGSRRRSVELWSDVSYVVPLPTDFHFRSVFAKGSKATDFERYELDDDCSQNTNSEPRSAYRMVKLLSLGGATCHRFPLAVLFHNLKALRIQKRWELDEKCLKNTYSNSGSAYRLVMLLPLGGATYCWIPLWVRFATFKCARISELVKSV
jgi:hypothetical protein